MTSLERYRTDPEYREKLKRYVVARERERRQSDPRYRRLKYLQSRVARHRTESIRRPRTPLADLHAEIHLLKKEIHDALALRPKKPKKPQAPRKSRVGRIRWRGRTAEQVRAGKLQHEANMTLAANRKEAKRERDEFQAAWTAKWLPIIGKRRKNCKKGTRKRRDKLIEASKKFGDHALAHQIRVIRNGPCKCYWCEKYLPDGGTVDHITPLAKGGAHVSGNLCAACSKCNSLKSDNSPRQVGLIETLL